MKNRDLNRNNILSFLSMLIDALKDGSVSENEAIELFNLAHYSCDFETPDITNTGSYDPIALFYEKQDLKLFREECIRQQLPTSVVNDLCEIYREDKHKGEILKNSFSKAINVDSLPSTDVGKIDLRGYG